MLIAVLVALCVVLIYGIVLVNGLYALRRQTQHALGQIDLQRKRRCDAVPKLVEIVKGDLSGEQETLEKLMQARSQALNAHTVIGKASAENLLHRSIDSVLALTQGHPDLEVSDDLISTREALRAAQNKIAFASQYYNDVANKYNLRLESFPSSLWASVGRFAPIDLFEVDGTIQREAVKAHI